MHGSPGGYDQIPALFPGFPSPAFGFLSWSRPGYLRTPLAIGPSFEQQADLLAALLDALGIGGVALFAFSGGGPTAVHFAARHPQRTWALILESAVTRRRPWVRSRFLGSRIGNRLLNLAADVRPCEVFGALLRTESGLDAERARDAIARALHDPTRAAVLRGWLRSASPAVRRRDGLANDAARIEALGDLPLEAVSAPTLILHGRGDADVPVEDAERAARLVRGAELVRVPDGLHLLPLADNASELAATREAFLRRHARTSPVESPHDGGEAQLAARGPRCRRDALRGVGSHPAASRARPAPFRDRGDHRAGPPPGEDEAGEPRARRLGVSGVRDLARRAAPGPRAGGPRPDRRAGRATLGAGSQGRSGDGPGGGRLRPEDSRTAHRRATPRAEVDLQVYRPSLSSLQDRFEATQEAAEDLDELLARKAEERAREAGRLILYQDLGNVALSLLAGAAVLAVIRLARREQRARARAEAAVRSRDQVVSIVSHDLRNPLANVSIAASLLLESRPAGEEWVTARKHLEIIKRNCDRMNRMIQDLLDVARIESGRLAVEMAPVAVESLMDEVATMLRPDVERRGRRLDRRVTSGLPPISADRDRLLQVFSNLVDNAVKFTATGGTITLTAEGDQRAVSFCVSDTGSGIPPEQVPHLFDRFWQARRTDRRGIGLGLSIVKGLVEAHGGHMAVESTPGQGTSFRFSVPVAAPVGARP